MIRAPYKKLEDANFLFDVCRAKGVRPWIWAVKADVDAFGGDEAFCRGIGKDVLLSGWYYGHINNCPDPTEGCSMAAYYKKFAEWGYEQVPTSSTWSIPENSEETMELVKKFCSPALVKGFMTAPWKFTYASELYDLLGDAHRFGLAKEKIYPEQCK